jgi:hypothetical protein
VLGFASNLEILVHVASVHVRIDSVDGTTFFYAGRILDKIFYHVEKSAPLERTVINQ